MRLVWCIAGVMAISGCIVPEERAGSEPEVSTVQTRSAKAPLFGFGSPASTELIAQWDTDIEPDGTGLPPGRGSVREGETIYRTACAACHGPTATEGPNARLVGRDVADFSFGATAGLLGRRTIGNYWPYATTLYDYIDRAMPQNAPGSLSPNQIYALVAYLLHLNEIVPEDAVMNAATLPAVVMPARDRFVPDDRRGGPEVR